jgi:Abi-like protein
MRYKEFENIMSPNRMNRYVTACNGNTKKAMTLYRLNLRLSQEMFTVISCFEVAIRNAIDKHYTTTLGSDWLRNSVALGGIFDNRYCRITALSIRDEIQSLGGYYSHGKLVAGLGFGIWRYLFASHQYQQGGSNLLRIFPAKPRSTAQTQYNQSFVFNQLAQINGIRNRIAHHEPICFKPSQPIKSTQYARQHYNLILQLFQWMSVNESAVLYGLDHINRVCNDIDSL